MATAAEFWMGGDTLRVPMTLHRRNRDRLASESRSASPAIALLQGGVSTTRHATDHEPVFRQESFFHWAFGVREPDCWGVIDLPSGSSTLFVPRLPAEYAIWMGDIKGLEWFREKYAVDRVRYVDELSAVLQSAHDERKVVHLLHGTNSDSSNVMQPPELSAITGASIDVHYEWLFETMSALRVLKTSEEVQVMRYASKVSAAAHVDVMKRCGRGELQFEYQMEAAFCRHAYHHGGCRHVGYTCICASGINAATLHYGHAGAPNDRQLRRGDMCLLDMGAEYHCYGSDITCSFPFGGKFTPLQTCVYNAVLDANRTVRRTLRPGIMWEDMHILAEKVVLQHLKSAGYLQGDLDAMVADRVGAIFMPHGLGHLIGIDTHDVGGYLESEEKCPSRSSEAGLKSLRTRRLMEVGMLMTVEPGCYFIRHLIDRAFDDDNLRKYLVRTKLQEVLVSEGWGVRIEDVVLLTEDGCELLSDLPRDVSDIETIMAGEGREAQ